MCPENLAAWNTDSETVRSDYRGPKGETAMTINDTLRNCREQMELAFRFFEAMKPYIDIVDSIKASEMTKMNFLD